MAKPSQKLAQSLEALADLQRILKAADLFGVSQQSMETDVSGAF